MKKFALLSVTIIFSLTLSSTAPAVDRHDRYEGYAAGGPYPSRGAAAPPHQHAVYGQSYFFGHIGLYEPNNRIDGLRGYTTGGNFDVGIGSRVSPILAVEGAFGAFIAERGPNKVSVVPLTFGIRMIIPNPFIEPYIGGGVGLYFADLKEVAAPGFSGIDDSDSAFGGYGSIGLDFWLNPRIALNIEGKYHWAEPTFTSVAGNSFDVRVDGWTANMGVRVSF